MAEDVRGWSDELARDPASLAFLPLGEALRKEGQLDLALRVALRGLERHPHNAEAHDLLARIAVDRGELQRAFDEWDMVLRLVPGHVGALKGMAFVCFQQGNTTAAEGYLAEAAAHGPGDADVTAALANIRRTTSMRAMPEHDGVMEREGAADTPSPAAPIAEPRVEAVAAPPVRAYAPNDPRALFADILGEHEQTALLLDAQGFVLAGIYPAEDGSDVGAEVGAELSGVTDAARRAARHLDLGDWRAIVLETDVATVTMAPAVDDGLLLVAATRATPIGLVRRALERCVERAREWLEAAR